MKTIISILFLSLVSFNLISQHNIEGTVSDEQNDPIFFATVALYNTTDSTLVKAESADSNGKYVLTDINNGDYYLVATMLSYSATTHSNITLPAMSGQSIDLIMSQDATMLETIEIKGKTPLLEQKGDKLIVNVESNITNTGGSLLDVMKKVPGMLVVRDRLSLAGSGRPTILLNGKSTQYMDVQSLLRDMPGDNIKSVEIIHQPGAEYDAAGSGPIINIILKKNSLFGTNGTVSIGVGRGNKLWDYNTGLQLSHYAGNFNISGGIGYTRNAWAEELHITRRLTDITDDVNGEYSQINVEEATPTTNRGNLRMDWDITERHRFGIDSKYYNNSNNYVSNNNTDIDLFQANATDFSLNSQNEFEQSWNYQNINPYYIFEIDTAGQKLEVDLSTARYRRNSYNTLTTTSDLDTEELAQRYDQPGNTKIYAATVDYTIPLSNSLDLKSGLKYSFADLDNNLIAELRDQQSLWFSNPGQSNHYLFEETIQAAYAKLNWDSGNWSGTAGLRYEDSNSIGNSITLDSIQERRISKLFPSFSLSRKLGESLKSTITYSRRINRPRYSSLNPFIYYIDPFTSDRGNPNLRPELAHSAKFTLSYDGQPFFNVEYKQSSDAIVEVTEQEQNNQEAFKTSVNFDKRTQFSTSLFFPLSFIPGVDGYAGVIMSKNSFDSRYIGNQFNQSKWNATSFLQAEFELPGEIQAELGAWFTSGSQEGIFQAEYLYGTSFGVSKKFLDSKMKVSMGVEDFLSRFWHASVDYQQDLNLIATWQVPTVSLKISYKFGNQHLKTKKKGSGSASEEIKRVNQ